MVPGYSEIFFSRFGGPILAERVIADLNEGDKQRLSAIMRTRHYRQGQTIFSRDIAPLEILVFTKGTAELTCGDGAVKTRFVAQGEIFGLTETLAEAKYCDNLTAVTDCETSVIGRDDLIWYLRHTPEACYRSLEAVAENFNKAREMAMTNIEDV